MDPTSGILSDAYLRHRASCDAENLNPLFRAMRYAVCDLMESQTAPRVLVCRIFFRRAGSWPCEEIAGDQQFRAMVRQPIPVRREMGWP